MRSAVVLFGAIALITAVWVVMRLLRAFRMRRSFGAGSEDRRMRDDPRFTQAWVEHVKGEATSWKSETGKTEAEKKAGESKDPSA